MTRERLVLLEELLREFRYDEDNVLASSIQSAPTLASAFAREEYGRKGLDYLDSIINVVHNRVISFPVNPI